MNLFGFPEEESFYLAAALWVKPRKDLVQQVIVHDDIESVSETIDRRAEQVGKNAIETSRV